MIRETAVAVLAIALLAGPAAASCGLATIAELPVTMVGTRPLVPAKINGAEALFLADSGAFYSMISPGAAAQFGLRLNAVPGSLTVKGIGGLAEVQLATVKQFTLAGIPIPRVQFLVGGSEPGQGAAGALGQNVLGLADVEYDLANGALRLMRPNGCENRALAYWAKSLPVSTLDTGPTTPREPHTTAAAFVNGVRIRVIFDTGASTSVLSLAAAARAGVTPKTAGAFFAGAGSGVGRRAMQEWIAPFTSFKIGDEEIRNTRLRIGAVALPNADMLLGADFFLSHRVYVAKSQHKLYFTYNGGPVFKLFNDASPAPVATAKEGLAPIEPGATADAAGMARLGAGFAARRDFPNAIAELSRAAVMDPKSARYLHQRAMAYLGNRQPFLAMADLDRALELDPDDVPARISRAELRLADQDKARAIADLDVASRLAAKQADERLRIAGLYLRGDSPAPAVTEFDLWIAVHPDDSRRVRALNGRCWARALLGSDLDKALADCDAAHRINPKQAEIFDSRGLVRLRRGELDKAIADYDAALVLRPKIAWSLYGRGLAKLRKGMTAEGRADLAEAAAIQPSLPGEAKTRGIAP